ncbi:MAG: transcriptional repressor [Clostridia bacterium]|nr:transcriptional repressor [Clostridia bacterium]
MKRRSTKQRDIVYSALLELYHPTADEVFESLQHTHPTIGRATVFRNLTVLVEEGRVYRLNFPGDGARYDPFVDGHTHFSCRSCKKIIDLPPVDNLPYPKSDEYVIETHTVKYYGLCRDCYQTTK